MKRNIYVKKMMIDPRIAIRGCIGIFALIIGGEADYSCIYSKWSSSEGLCFGYIIKSAIKNPAQISECGRVQPSGRTFIKKF